jgi:lipopolysaccharide heptosyltransferase II
VSKFILVNPFGIGDVLFTTPLLTSLKEDNPSHQVSYWCNERVSELLATNPGIDKVFALSRGDLKRLFRQSKLKGVKKSLGLLAALKRERFAAAFDFSLDHRYGLLLKLAGVKKRFGYDYKRRGRFLTDSIRLSGFGNRHIADYYLDLLKLAGIKPASRRLEVFLSGAEQRRAGEILASYAVTKSDTLIGLAPGAGASWGKDAALKHWPAARFAELADRLTDYFKAKVLIFGDDAERPLANKLISQMKTKPIDLAGRTSLKEFASLIGRLQLLVCNDGGPLHLAVALGVKTVSLFGPVDERVYGPYPASPKHKVIINRQIPCRPCYQDFRLPVCRNQRRCIEDIDVEEVFQAVKAAIAS